MVAWRQRAQRIENDGDVDRFLRQRAGNRRQPTDWRKAHRDSRHRHAGHDALHRDAAGALGDRHRVGDAIEPIDQDDDIGRLRRGAGATAPIAMPTSAAASAGASLMPSPTITVGCKPLLGRDRIDLVGRDPIGEHGVEIERRPDGFGRVGPVAGQHDDARRPRRHVAPGRRAASRAAARRPEASAPIVRPSTATKTLSAERQAARRSARTAQSSGLRAP